MNVKDCKDVESQVRHIAQLMATNAWAKSMYAELCEVWQIDASTLRKRSAEAHRLFAFSDEERVQFRAMLAEQFKTIAKDALASSNNITGLPDYRSALQALELYGRYASLDSAPVLDANRRPERIVIVRHERPDSSIQSTARSDVPGTEAG